MSARSPFGLLAAFVGWFLLAFPPVAHVTTYAVPAKTPVTDFVATGVVAALAGYAYWRREGSVRKLGGFLVTVAALLVLVGLPALVVLRVFGFPVSSDPATGFLAGVAVLSLVYAAAIRRVW